MKIGPRKTAIASALSAVALLAAACGSGSDGSESDGVLIGMSQALSGATGTVGNDVVRGAKLAVKEINGKGGVNGAKIKISTQDNACNATDGVNAYNKLTSGSTKPSVIIGAFCSSATLATMPLLERAGVPLLVGGASAPAITEAAGVGGNDWLFRFGTNDDLLARGAVEYLKGTDYKRVAVIVSNDDYGQGGYKAFKAALGSDSDIEIVDYEKLDLENTADYSTALARVKASNPDVVGTWMNAALAGQLKVLQQYGQGGLADIPLVGRPVTSEAFLPVYKEYGIHGVSDYSYSVEADVPETKEYVEKFRAEYGDDTDPLWGFVGYQGIYVAAQAIEDAGSTDPEAVKEALKDVEYSPTLLGGTIEFDDHHQAHDNVVRLEFNGDKVNVLGVVETE